MANAPAGRLYQVTITGEMPLLMHADNIEWGDAMTAWQNAPGNKGKSKAGDDRTPAWRWLGSINHDGERVVIPRDNLMRSIMGGGALVPVGRGNKTYKSQSQSGMLVMEDGWPLLVSGKEIPIAPILELEGETSFAAHVAAAKKAGFMLFVKRAKPPSGSGGKHVRVRPRFDNWSASGTVLVWDDAITADVLSSIMLYAGARCGLGNWRPSCPTPGPFGRYVATVKLAKV